MKIWKTESLVDICNPSTKEAEGGGGLPNLRPPGLHSKILSQRKKQKKTKFQDIIEAQLLNF